MHSHTYIYIYIYCTWFAPNDHFMLDACLQTIKSATAIHSDAKPSDVGNVCKWEARFEIFRRARHYIPQNQYYYNVSINVGDLKSHQRNKQSFEMDRAVRTSRWIMFSNYWQEQIRAPIQYTRMRTYIHKLHTHMYAYMHHIHIHTYIHAFIPFISFHQIELHTSHYITSHHNTSHHTKN